MTRHDITDNNVRIYDSAFYSKRSFWTELALIYAERPDCLVFTRNINSLLNEWATHNALYALHILRSHTKDVDLNYGQSWYARLGYFIFGNLVWPFIK